MAEEGGEVREVRQKYLRYMINWSKFAFWFCTFWDYFWQLFFQDFLWVSVHLSGLHTSGKLWQEINQQVTALMMMTKLQKRRFFQSRMMKKSNDIPLSFLFFGHYLLCYIQLWDHLLAVRSYWNLHWARCFDQVSCVFDTLPETAVDDSVGLSFYPMTVSIPASISKGGDKFQGPCVNNQITQTPSFPDDMKNLSRALS